MTILGKYMANGDISRAIDGAHVPADEGNRDYRELMALLAIEGNEITSYSPPAVTPSDVHAERDRRLAGGFDYDFGDARGVHRIDTTQADMIGWNAVSTLAQAAINVGEPTTIITIVTGSGAAQLTAMEWQTVLIAAGQFQQPIWGASFVLAEMNPIPADFRDDAYWSLGS